MKLEICSAPLWWRTRGGMAGISGIAIRELIGALRSALEDAGHFCEVSTGRRRKRGGWDEAHFIRRLGAVGTFNYVVDAEWDRVIELYQTALHRWRAESRAEAFA